MTKYKIDDLFQQKLANSEFSPSPAAWSKLESQLAQKKKKGAILWMSAAASIALFITLGWLIFRTEEDILTIDTIAQIDIEEIDTTIPIDTFHSEDNTSIVVEDQISKKTKEQEQNKNVSQSNKNRLNRPLIISQQKSELAINNIFQKTQDHTIDKKVAHNSLITDTIESNSDETIALALLTQQTNTSSKKSQSIKLIYTLKPAISSESITQEVAEETKNSPFKKIFAFAKNVKENPQGIGNLRDAKNNLLSFNKKKKNSKQ